MWTTNPLTGRTIKVGGPTYRSLLASNILQEVVDKLPRVEVVKWVVRLGKYKDGGHIILETKVIDPDKPELLDQFLRRHIPMYWPQYTVLEVKDALIDNDFFDDYGKSQWYIQIENIGTDF